ncbi:MAG: WD40 repeat protein [Oceanicoccus sp.]|jgi:WD40 repeat protein
MVYNISWPQQLATLLICMLFLSGCDNSSAPTKSWETAVKGSYSASLSADGELSLIGSITHGGSLWQTQRGERLFNWNHKQGEVSNIIASGFSPAGLYALTADHQTLVLWDTSSGQALTFWTAPNEVMSIDLTPNGNYALLGLADYSAVLFDVKKGGIKRSFYHQDRVRSVALSDDGKLALTGSEDQTAKLWNLNSGEELFSWQHEDEVVTVALSPDGSKAFTVAKYDKAVIWDTTSGIAIGELPLGASAIKRGQSFTSARFSASGQLLLTGNSDRLVQLWDSKKLSLEASWMVPKRDHWKPTSASILAVSFSSKSKQYYAITSNGFSHQLSR